MPATTPGGELKREDIVVFKVRRDARCDECGGVIGSGYLLFRQGERGLCMSCADMDHLFYLQRGDAALTRRARKHSRLSAVVLQWSRTRKQYERQGVLAEEEALARAEEECLGDADLRAARRERERMRRAELDAQYVSEFAQHIRDLYPGCPPEEAERIAEHACLKHSRRVGRSAAAKEFAPEAVRCAVLASIRHRHTAYDDLLMSGMDRSDARDTVAGDVWQVEDLWKR